LTTIERIAKTNGARENRKAHGSASSQSMSQTFRGGAILGSAVRRHAACLAEAPII
jgi:hypothetical protein